MAANNNPALSRYAFLVETYATEILKVLSVWSMFSDADLRTRPHDTDQRGRNLLEHMVHQSMSEDLWFKNMFGIQVTEQALPENESRLTFMQAYNDNAQKRLAALQEKDDAWWEEEVKFFEATRSRAWVMTRRIAHTAHHRGQQTTLLRICNHSLHSTYGPTADTGGLMKDKAPVIYPYADAETLLREEAAAARKRGLPGAGGRAVTERP